MFRRLSRFTGWILVAECVVGVTAFALGLALPSLYAKIPLFCFTLLLLVAVAVSRHQREKQQEARDNDRDLILKNIADRLPLGLKAPQPPRLFFDARGEFLPTRVPPSGHLKIFELQPRSTGDEVGEVGELSSETGNLRWPKDALGFPLRGERCEITNYGDDPILNLEVTFEFLYRDYRLEGPNEPDVKRRALVIVPRVEAGADRAFVFYMINSLDHDMVFVKIMESVKYELLGDPAQHTAIMSISQSVKAMGLHPQIKQLPISATEQRSLPDAPSTDAVSADTPDVRLEGTFPGPFALHATGHACEIRTGPIIQEPGIISSVTREGQTINNWSERYTIEFRVVSGLPGGGKEEIVPSLLCGHGYSRSAWPEKESKRSALAEFFRVAEQLRRYEIGVPDTSTATAAEMDEFARRIRAELTFAFDITFWNYEHTQQWRRRELLVYDPQTGTAFVRHSGKPVLSNGLGIRPTP